MPDLTPEDYRRRYEALKAEGQKPPQGHFTPTPTMVPSEAVLYQETVPPGWYWSRKLTRGESLRISDPSGRASVSALLWNAADTSERLNPADTVKVQWTARIGGGRLLLSDMGRVLAAITADSSGFHDCLAGGSTPSSNARKYGAVFHRNTRDNFLLAAGKLGLSPRDVGPCVTFFAPVVTDAEGRLGWQENRRPGQYVELRAELDVLIVLSNCHHPLDPEQDGPSAPITLAIWRAPEDREDWCRTATAEARRAYENNAAYLAQGGAP